MFIYFWKRERERERERGRERGRHKIWGRLQALAVSAGPNVRRELTNHEIMTWAEVRCWTDWATQAPLAHAHIESETRFWNPHFIQLKKLGKHNYWWTQWASPVHPSCQKDITQDHLHQWCACNHKAGMDFEDLVIRLSWSRENSVISHSQSLLN